MIDHSCTARPPRPSLRVPEEITHNVSPSTRITIRVGQPSRGYLSSIRRFPCNSLVIPVQLLRLLATRQDTMNPFSPSLMWSEVTTANQAVSAHVFPSRRLASSSLIDHLIQALPPIQRWRASIQQPLLLLQSTHQSVSTSIFLCVRTPFWLTDHLAPSLHGRSPRRERPVVGFSDPIGEPTREHQYSQI